MPDYAAGYFTLPPNWNAQTLVALVRFRPPDPTVNIVWHPGNEVRDLLWRIIDICMLVTDENTSLLENRFGEVVGYRDGSHVLFAVPIAKKAWSEMFGLRRTFTPRRFGTEPNTAVTEVMFYDNGEEVCAAMTDGVTATKEILFMACDPKAELLGAPDDVYGVRSPEDGRTEFWDVDIETWRKTRSTRGHQEHKTRRRRGDPTDREEQRCETST